MTVFSCPTCGSHTFMLSADLKQTACEDCKVPLGSWRLMRARLKQNLRLSQAGPFSEVEPESTVVSFRRRIS